MAENAKERPGMVIFFETWEPLFNQSDDETVGRVFRDAFMYSKYGVIPELKDGLENIFWSYIKPSLDRAEINYWLEIDKKRYAAAKSAVKRQYQSQRKSDLEIEVAMKGFPEFDEWREKNPRTPLNTVEQRSTPLNTAEQRQLTRTGNGNKNKTGTYLELDLEGEQEGECKGERRGAQLPPENADPESLRQQELMRKRDEMIEWLKQDG